MSGMKNFQLTLAILKPDVTRTPHAYQVIKNVLEKENFLIAKRKMIQLTRTEIERFYEEHRNKFFYNRLTSFMISGPIEVMILGQTNAIKRWRDIMGPTKVFKTHFQEPNSLRGLIGLTDTRNATHGSDSVETAQREIKFFFPTFSCDQWIAEGKPSVDLATPYDDFFQSISLQEEDINS